MLFVQKCVGCYEMFNNEIKDKYYRFKMWVRNIFLFREALSTTSYYDYDGTLIYMQIHFGCILKAMKKGWFLQEYHNTRTPKEKDLSRVIELINNMRNDNYSNRCGYDDDYDINYIPVPNTSFDELVDTQTESQKINNKRASIEGMELEEKEWKEFNVLLFKMREWWI
jgi:hypothetical protein